MLKRIFALVFCGILLFSFAACGTQTPDTDVDTSSSVSSEGASEGSSGVSSDKGSEEAVFDYEMEHKFLACDVLNHSIVVYDLNKCNEVFENLTKDTCIIWEWDSDEDKTCKGKPSSGLDAAKIRYSEYYEADVVIVCSSVGWAGVIDYETKTTLWEIEIPGSNLHSVEMMPNGDLVLVGSGDAGKVFYVPLSTGETSYTATLDAPSGHGACYDPTNDFLWILDYDEIFACKVENYGEKDVTLSRVKDKAYNFKVMQQEENGHVLTPVAGQPGKYWMAAKRLWIFDSNEMTLNRIFKDSGKYGAQESNWMKGLAHFEDGTMVQTVPKWGGGTLTEATCGGFRVVVREEGEDGGVDVNVTRVYFKPRNREFYKVTTFTKNYQ